MKKSILLILSAMTFMSMAAETSLDVVDGKWSISCDSKKMALTFSYDGNAMIKRAGITATDAAGDVMKSSDYPEVTLSTADVNDGFGAGKCYTWLFSGLEGENNLATSVYIYPELSYILVEGSVISSDDSTIAITQINPVVSSTVTALPLPEEENYIFDMPFANDSWSTFNAIPWNTNGTNESCEASAFFNLNNRNGLVVGSVDHTTWKSAVLAKPTDTNSLLSLTLKAGHVSKETWDVVSQSKINVHGAVKGQTVKSPRFFVGFYEDWRVGMETFADANTVICPRYEWTKDSSLFGWQSWGGMAEKVNYNSAMSVLDFYEQEIQPLGFANKEGRLLMVLDSYWDNFSQRQLLKFAKRCKELGFVPGIYTTPFTYWGSKEQVEQGQMWENYPLSEMVLKANGVYRKISGFSLDPTHPGVKDWNRRRIELVKELGFEFIKLDFMNNGSQEADSWYDPNITTGMQAYNYGMDYLREFCGDDMFIDLSIAPVFPAKAHGRRIGCDAWGSLAHSSYTLNNTTGSWWLDHMYLFNDPDHLCVYPAPGTGQGSNSVQEGRVRYTTGLIHGMVLMGGTYAYEGDNNIVGSDRERRRLVNFASNIDLTRVGQIGRTFRPVNGNYTVWRDGTWRTDNEFCYDDGDAFYYVVFNISGSYISKTPDYERLGVSASEFENITELWNYDEYTPEEFEVEVPPMDVCVYRMERAGFSGVESVVADASAAVAPEVYIEGDNCVVVANELIQSVSVYTVDGRLVAEVANENLHKAELNVASAVEGVVIVRTVLESGASFATKLTKH